MTQGQRETLHLIYVNVCNALIYADNMLLENVSKSVKDPVRVVRDKLKWIKTSFDLKVGHDMSLVVDTLRYEEINRLLASLPKEYEDRLEQTIVNFLNDISNEMDQVQKLPEDIHADGTQEKV